MSAADRAVGHEADALRLELGDPAVDVVLLQLEVRDAVAEQAADRVVALVHDDVVTGPGQLLGGGEPGRSGADDRHPLAGALGSRARHEVTRTVGDLDLDQLDRHRLGRHRCRGRRPPRTAPDRAGR